MKRTFPPGDHDSEAKTILGQTGPWGRDDVVRIVCGQPAAATHIARRLYRTFISTTDEPNSELLEALAPLADAMRVKGDVDVARGIELVLRSRIFHSDECRTTRVKGPVVLAIGAIRGDEAFAPPPDLVELEIHLTRMGQRLFYPPNVAGWPGGMAWLRGSTVLARANFAAWLTDPSSGLCPGHFRDLAERHRLQNAAAWLDAMAVLLSGATVASESKDELLALVRSEPDPARLHGRILTRVLSLPEGQVG